MSQQLAEQDEWLTTQELADWLKVPVATIYQWRYTKTGPLGYKIGRHVRFRRQDVEAWLGEQHRVAQVVPIEQVPAYEARPSRRRRRAADW